MGCTGSKDKSSKAPVQVPLSAPSMDEVTPRSPGTIHRHEQALLNAAEDGDVAGLTAAVALGADLECVDFAGFTALHVACSAGHGAVVKKLLTLCSGPSRPNHEGDTALHLASANGHSKVVDLLLDANAEVSWKNCAGLTALQVAQRGAVDHRVIASLQQAQGSLDNDGSGTKALFELQLPPETKALPCTTFSPLHEGPPSPNSPGIQTSDEPSPNSEQPEGPSGRGLSRAEQRRKKYKEKLADDADGDQPAEHARKSTVMEIKQAPEELSCKLYGKLCWDPVYASDDQLYERAAIMKWFERRNTTSPVTRQELDHQRVRGAPEIRSQGEAWVHSQASGAGRSIGWTELILSDCTPPTSKYGDQGARRQCFEANWGGIPVVLVRAAPGAAAVQVVPPLSSFEMCEISMHPSLVAVYGHATDPANAETCWVCAQSPGKPVGTVLRELKSKGCRAGLGAKLKIAVAIVEAASAAATNVLAGWALCLHNCMAVELDADAASMDCLLQLELQLSDSLWHTPLMPNHVRAEKAEVTEVASARDRPSSSRIASRRKGGAFSARSATPRALSMIGLTHIRWQPPEAFTGGWTEDGGKSVVWSVGISIWQVFADGKTPYRELRHDEAVAMKVAQGTRPQQLKGCPMQVYKLLERCWALDAANRPSISELATALEKLDLVALQLELQDDEDLSSSDDSDSDEDEDDAGQMEIMAQPRLQP